MPEIPKAYDPKAVEDRWYQFWLDQKCFVADPARVSPKRPAYSIVIPPPNVTGVLHMGHVLNNTIQDILARKARMDGKEVLWLPGTDHAGIATQVQVEKALLKEGKTKDELGREEFLKRVWAWKEKHGGIIIQQLKKLGCSCDWTRERFTMDPEYSRCVQKVFIALYRKGLIYRGKRMVNWDPATRTALSDEEVEMIETRGHLWHLKYPLLDEAGRPLPDQFVVVATTRPETMLGDEAVAVNPRDPRYRHLVGRRCFLPLQNKPIPIIADELVDPKFGTGCVKVTPAHDPADYEMAVRHKLPLTVVIGPDGRMTAAAGARFAGLDRMDARKAVVAALEQQGLLLKVEDYVHNVGYSQRSHVPIEPYLSEQWFLKYPSVEPALRCVELGAASDKEIRVVKINNGHEPGGSDRAQLREAAWHLVRRNGWLGRAFPNEDTGWQIYVGRRSLSHAFNNRNPATLRALAALPELIRTAVWWRTEAHEPPHPRFKQVHHFLAAMEMGGDFYCVPIVVKELADGTLLCDYKTQRAAPGGKPLVARLPEETLGIQPAPGAARFKLADLLPVVKPHIERPIRFHPDRWVKTYTHWMRNLKDWCISRQLWWGHRIPVWYNRTGRAALTKIVTAVEQGWDEVCGRNAAQMREHALQLARERGILNSDFLNLDTGWKIYVQKSSLEHAFSNRGLQNIKLVPALPALLRHAVLLGSEFHRPPAPDVRAVHTFVALLKLGFRLYRVTFTVKELTGGRKLYDHQAVELLKKQNGLDGKYPPEARPLAETLAPRPASSPQWTVADLLGDVNRSGELVRAQADCPGPGWEQDPDVLDTWFSSWLWPFATMGWTGDPKKDAANPTLRTFYPTTDLVTGPDIIFFWVARMIMAGFEFMGERPFDNVYFTGIIRDKLGRKMSKTLGNSPDPLELIAKYGADALRFGTMRSAPLGQDVLFDEKDVELGRNFCNKLWNACRFRQLQGGTVQGEINPLLLTSDDKWILLKLDAAIREITDALAGYNFNTGIQALYRFFWSEFCDWYLEASKATLTRPAEPQNGSANQPTNDAAHETRRANTLAVMDFVLSHALRLFHPFLPFITEELWQSMGYAQDMPQEQGGKTIMTAPWPKPLSDDEKAHFGLADTDLEFAEHKYELVRQGRNLRRIGNIPAGRKVRFVLKPRRDLVPHDLEVMRLLLNAERIELDGDFAPRKGTPAARTPLGDLFLPLEGLVDVAAETARLRKELDKADAEIARLDQRLADPNFTARAPAHVLEEHRRRRADWQAKREHLLEALKVFEG